MARSLDFKILMRWLLSDTTPRSASRRRFLNQTAVGGLATATLATSACTTLDRWVLGDGSRLENEVLVLGGGLAGLAAAYQLKKNHIPYRVYEASSRLGGRIQTLYYFNQDKQFAEAGAEFFEAGHHELIQLCQDLGLKTQDVSYDMKSDRGIYWLGGKAVAEKEFRKSLKPLALKFAQLRSDITADIAGDLRITSVLGVPQAKIADGQSLSQAMDPFRKSLDPAVIECFENLCKSEWGVDTTDINLLHFLVRLAQEERTLASAPSKIFRIEGGTARLIQVLGERVQGILPGYTLKLEYQLVEVKQRNGGFQMTFKTPKGHDSVWARQVICTLPWSILKDVEGIRNIGLHPLQNEGIENAVYATHSKAICSFKEPLWKIKKKGVPSSQGVFRGQLLGQNYWDSSRGQEGSHGLATSQRGGKRNQEISAENAAAECVQDLQHFFKDLPAPDAFHLSHWQRKPFAKGSRFHSLPGRYLRHLEMLSIPNDKVAFYFAGEHMSFRDAGSMNGAVETAWAAAAKAMQMSHTKIST